MPDLVDLRLRSHRLVAPARTVLEAARVLTATQGQDFWAARFALAQRTAGHPAGAPITLRDVDRAFDRGELIRSWTMRGTLHVVLPADLPRLLAVTADRMRRAAAPRHRELGLDDEVRRTAERLVRDALRGGNALPRAEAFAVLESGGIDPAGQRGYHLLAGLAVDGVLCWGPVVDRPGSITREQRLVLVEDCCPVAVPTPSDPEAAAAELFARYAAGHGPVTDADFAWWTGLPVGAARRARQAALAGDIDRGLERVEFDGTEMVAAARPPDRSPGAAPVIALPSFDEYYLSYADRTRVCGPEHLGSVGPGRNGMVRPVLVGDGRVVGTWRVGRTPAAGSAARAPAPEAEPFVDLDTASLARALARAAAILTP